MEFQNLTWFPAMTFQGVTQKGTLFHVLVLRQTYSFGKGTLVFAEQQSPFCEEDAFFGASGESSPQAESDLCPWKPRCDLVVDAIAHVPDGAPARTFPVRFRVWRPGAEACLVDKHLVVSGPSEIRRLRAPLRASAALLRWATLGLFEASTWRRTRPEPITSLPIRYEHAYGGHAKLMVSDPASARIPPRHCLPGIDPRQLREVFEVTGADAPLAWEINSANPVGKGWTRPWFLQAAGCDRIPAPQIEAPGAQLTGALFQEALQDGEAFRTHPAFRPQGLGLLGKSWMPRRTLVGTVDDAWAENDAPLPEDFDFAIFNGAPPDQCLPYLAGDEILELTNLCAPGSPGAGLDAHGNVLLRLELPGHLPLLLVRTLKGRLDPVPLDLDTVRLEPEATRLVLVWRAIIPVHFPIRSVHARILGRKDRDEWVRKGLLRGIWPPSASEPEAPPEAPRREGTYG